MNALATFISSRTVLGTIALSSVCFVILTPSSTNAAIYASVVDAAQHATN